MNNDDLPTFLFRRHLAQILSVCCLPVRSTVVPIGDNQPGETEGFDSDDHGDLKNSPDYFLSDGDIREATMSPAVNL